MKTITINEILFIAASVISEDTPIVMLNLLRYKKQANYSEENGHTPCSGSEAYYNNYVPAFNKIAANTPGIRLLWLGNALTNIVGPPDETWDDIALVEYPGFAAFRAVTESEEYKIQAEFHRIAALDDWRLIAGKQAILG